MENTEDKKEVVRLHFKGKRDWYIVISREEDYYTLWEGCMGHGFRSMADLMNELQKEDPTVTFSHMEILNSQKIMFK